VSREVTHDGAGSLHIRFPFDRSLVACVKSLPRRRWIATERYWQVPETDVLELVELLAAHRFAFDEATRELYEAHGGERTLDGRPEPQPARPMTRGLFDEPAATEANGATAGGGATDYTVAGLNQRVKEVLGSAFPGPIWLVGEIAGFNKSAHRRHVGFELVEREADGSTVSKVGATLFEGTRREIERRLQRAGDPFSLQDEITVRMAVRVELYVPWGSYRVIVEDIDLEFTLGEAARRREEILRRLAAAGLTGVNDALPLPELPLRVGLITSLGSDAYNDVLRTMQESGFAFSVLAHGARVQGRATEPSVLNALEALCGHGSELDVVLICRGGGSRTDLVWFDSEKLGTAVATCPLPVIVGIGHEQDRSVLDGVARSRKTPTAAASLLVEQVRAALERVETASAQVMAEATRSVAYERRRAADRGRRLATTTRALLRNESDRIAARRRRLALGAGRSLISGRDRLDRQATAIPREAGVRLAEGRAALAAAVRSMAHGARRDLETARRTVTTLAASLEPRSKRLAERELERLAARERSLLSLDPRRVVERGYAILRGDGGVLTDAAAAPAGTKLQAELRTGVLDLISQGAARSRRKE
jgi:exodeoxyribonuclease VII large subunit